MLDTIDDAIRKTEQIIAKLQQVKQGLLHDLLTRGIDDNGELRDPDRHPEQFQDSPHGHMPKSWGLEKLRSVYSEASRNGLYKPPASHGSGPLMIQMGNIFSSDEVSFANAGRVEVTPTELRTFGIRVGDLLFARRSLVFEGAGKVALVRSMPEPATFESSIVRVRLNEARVLPAFALVHLSSHPSYLHRRTFIRQVAVSGVSSADIAQFLLALPPPAEQHEICARLAEVDQRVAREVATASKLRLTKAGLAEDLLSGRVRTTPLGEVTP